MLKKLEIQALRGATKKLNLEFEKDKKITILYGENGSGKSTICDAIELLSDGRIGSLDGRGLGKTESYWHSTGKKPGDVEITLTTTTGQWVARVASSKAVVTPMVDRPQAAILRRNQIQGLIAQQPKNRFDAIRPFLDVGSVESSEGSLKKLIDDEKKDLKIAVARIEENQVAVENFWKAAGSPKPNALAWARVESANDTTRLQKEIAMMDLVIKEIEELEREHAQLNQVNTGVVTAQAEVKLAEEKVNQEQKKLSGGITDLVGILEAAKTYFIAHTKPDSCPLCGSKELAVGLPGRVEAQLQTIKSLTNALWSRDLARKNLDIAEAHRKTQAASFGKSASTLASRVTGTTLPAGLTFSPEIVSAANAMQAATKDDSELNKAATPLLSQTKVFLPFARSTLAKMSETKGTLQTLKNAVATYDANYADQKDLDVLLPNMEKALEAIQDERRQFVDGILKSISKRVGELYEEIHPGEGLNKISLLLDPDKRASLEITSTSKDFGSAPPGAYFSDSHLDSLGFCIWLALSELQETAKIILVLDDIVASVDEPHVERLIWLLYTIAQKFEHCIFTTHYKPWREKYKWGWLRDGQVHFVELLPWSHAAGISHGKTTPQVEELRALLLEKPPSTQLICASAGVLLEAMLDYLTYLYACSVPRRKPKPTLGDLLPSVKGKLRAALKIERLEVPAQGSAVYKAYQLKPLLDELERIAQARNVFGAHFNELAAHLPDADAVRFSSTVLELADLLVDLDCGWPWSNKSGSFWSNRKDSRRLHPLVHPG